MEQENCHPEPGDLIEIDRPLYQHWALYLGDGYVIHVTDDGASSLSSGSSSIFSSSSIFGSSAKVKKQCLKEVVGNNKWRVNKYDRSRTPLPVEQIIQRAEQWIDKEVPYDVLNNNCEHFVTELRYRDPVSDQVEKALAHCSTISGAAGIGLVCACFLSTNPFLLAAAGVDAFASIGFVSATLRYIFTRRKFLRSGCDTPEQMCC